MNDEKFLAHAAEAVLFSMGEPVDPGQLAAAMECGRADAVRIVRELKEEYDLEERGVQILEIGGKYQLCTREKYYEALIRVVDLGFGDLFPASGAVRKSRIRIQD